MFTYKFVGLDATDAPTPYFYGSLPAKPELGHVLLFDLTGNRYSVIRIEGSGLVDDGDGKNSQTELALADINRGERVPMLWLRKIEAQEPSGKEMQAQGRSFDPDKMKEYSQKNRETRFSPTQGRKKTMSARFRCSKFVAPNEQCSLPESHEGACAVRRPKMIGAVCECPFCHQKFASLADFDAHAPCPSA